MTAPANPTPAGEGPDLDRLVAELEALRERATRGPWKSWRHGNSSLRDGTVVGLSLLRPLERPYTPVAYWEATEEAHRSVVMTDANADYIAALVNAHETLISELRRLAGENSRLELRLDQLAEEYKQGSQSATGKEGQRAVMLSAAASLLHCAKHGGTGFETDCFECHPAEE